MSEVLGLVLELVLNAAGALLEAWLGDFAQSDTRACRIFWCIVLVLLGGLIWWELR